MCTRLSAFNRRQSYDESEKDKTKRTKAKEFKDQVSFLLQYYVHSNGCDHIVVVVGAGAGGDVHVWFILYIAELLLLPLLSSPLFIEITIKIDIRLC